MPSAPAPVNDNGTGLGGTGTLNFIQADMIWAPLDPRLTSMFHDVRLERTYVHLKSGFDLLAAGTPTRLTMPLSEWLPARYKAQIHCRFPGTWWSTEVMGLPTTTKQNP